jgi:hypothetical protein
LKFPYYIGLRVTTQNNRQFNGALQIKKICNYSAAIHQDGEKPVLFVPYFFRELLGFLLNWRKSGLKASNRLPVLARKAFEALIRKKGNVTSQKGLFATKTRPC